MIKKNHQSDPINTNIKSDATRYRKAILSAAFCAICLAALGCANGPSGLNFTPWAKAPDTVAGLLPPHERIENLRAIAARDDLTDPTEQQEISQKLATEVRSEEDPMIRGEIIRALGNIPTPTATSVIRSALQDTDKGVRILACEAWAKRDNSESVLMLSKILRDDSDTDVRLAAAKGLGQTSDKRGIGALGVALSDKDPALQRRAVLSLRELTGEDFDNDVTRWQQYVKGETPNPPKNISVADRIQQFF